MNIDGAIIMISEVMLEVLYISTTVWELLSRWHILSAQLSESDVAAAHPTGFTVASSSR